MAGERREIGGWGVRYRVGSQRVVYKEAKRMILAHLAVRERTAPVDEGAWSAYISHALTALDEAFSIRECLRCETHTRIGPLNRSRVLGLPG